MSSGPDDQDVGLAVCHLFSSFEIHSTVVDVMCESSTRHNSLASYVISGRRDLDEGNQGGWFRAMSGMSYC